MLGGQPPGRLPFPAVPDDQPCVTGSAGVVPTRKIRDMVSALAADEVPAGWYVSPMGFSLDARAYAEQHNVRLIDGPRLLEQLSDLPTFALPKVLALAG